MSDALLQGLELASTFEEASKSALVRRAVRDWLKNNGYMRIAGQER